MRILITDKHNLKLKWILGSLLLLLFICAFFTASAEELGSFSGRVWNDLDNNGQMDETEPGVGGVTLNLVRQDTDELMTTVSDENGYYIFTDLPNDYYAFSVTLPDSMLLARYTSEGDLRSILTGDDANNSRNFLVRASYLRTDMNVGLVDSAIIRGIAYLDMNYNGNYDEGEPPYAGVRLQMIYTYSEKTQQEIITGEDGVFNFNYIRSGNYRFRAIVPDDGSAFTLVPDTIGVYSNLFKPRPGRRENSVYELSFENSMVYEYYIGVTQSGQIGGMVFNDKDYSGVFDDSERKISGIAVQLIDTNGDVVSHTSTNRNGDYLLEDVMPGEYTLRFVRKDGYTFTKYRPDEEGGNDAVLSLADDYGETAPFTIQMRENLSGYNAGMVQAATLGGVFFNDENDNGLMDQTEGGFTDGSVRLISADGEIDLTQIVHEDGSYQFSGVPPTDYTLYYILPENAEMAKVTNGGNTLTHQGLENAVTGLTLQAKKSYKQPLVGAVNLGTFEGYAFEDLNANGIMDASEAALPGAAVSVAPAAMPENAVTAISDADGHFAVTGLRPGEYALSMQLPDGLIFSSDVLASGIPLDTTGTYTAPVLFSTLLRHMENYIGAVTPAILQASIFLDENRNGSQDGDERMMEGLAFTLFDETNGQPVMTVTSNADGIAMFTAVRPSTYSVSFTLPEDSFAVAGAGTMTEAGGVMSRNGIEVHAGDAVTDITGGITSTTSIGGSVMADQSSGRAPVAGVEVRLYMEGYSQQLQTAVSDEQGLYRFDGLWPGSYVIEVVRPDGYVFIRPNDPTLSTDESIVRQISDELGTSEPLALYMAQDKLASDVMLTIPAMVGSLVWLDENENGLIDGSEPMISGVTISLTQDGAAIYTTTSNEWGYYQFSNVYPGEYILRAYAYPELNITTAIPAVPIISSCLTLGDGSIAVSDPFSVTSESVNFFYHLGYVLKDGEKLPAETTESSTQTWTR